MQVNLAKYNEASQRCSREPQVHLPRQWCRQVVKLT